MCLAYGPVRIPNEVTIALMTSPVHLGSNTSQADDNYTTVLHFGVVQGCHKTRSPNPLIYFIYECNNWILKPFTASAYLPSHHMWPTLQHPKALLLPKSRPNELDNEVGTNTLERNTMKIPQKQTHSLIKAQLPQLLLDKLRSAVTYSRGRLQRTLSLVESNPVHLDVKTLSIFGVRSVDDPGQPKIALCEGMLKHLL